MNTTQLIKQAILSLKAKPKKAPLTHAEQIKLETTYWNDVLEEATKDEVLDLANRMGIYTHHDNGRQRALKQIKCSIAYDKLGEFRKALRENNNK